MPGASSPPSPPSRPPASAPTRGRFALRRVHREQAGFVMSFLLKIFIAFAILGLAVEEAGQVAVAQIHAGHAATVAAQAGADTWVRAHNRDAAYQAALDALTQEDPHAAITAFGIADDGTVTVTTQEVATTLIVQHVSFLKKVGIQHSTVSEIHSLASTR